MDNGHRVLLVVFNLWWGISSDYKIARCSISGTNFNSIKMHVDYGSGFDSKLWTTLIWWVLWCQSRFQNSSASYRSDIFIGSTTSLMLLHLLKHTSTSPANIRLSQGSIKLIGLTEDTDYDVYCFAQDRVENSLGTRLFGCGKTRETLPWQTRRMMMATMIIAAMLTTMIMGSFRRRRRVACADSTHPKDLL